MLLWMFACQAGVQLDLGGDASFDAAATAHVVLWGYDTNVADVPATAVDSFEFEVLALPHSEPLEVRAKPWTRIEQFGSGPVKKKDARYYFSVAVDADGDGQMCAGDWDESYDLNEMPQFFDAVPDSVSIDLAEVSGDCYPM